MLIGTVSRFLFCTGWKMRVVFELIVNTDDDMGFDTPAAVQEILEEVIHDSIPAGISTEFQIKESDGT